MLRVEAWRRTRVWEARRSTRRCRDGSRKCDNARKPVNIIHLSVCYYHLLLLLLLRRRTNFPRRLASSTAQSVKWRTRADNVIPRVPAAAAGTAKFGVLLQRPLET